MHMHIFENGAYICKERTNKKASLYTQLRTMADNPRRFQDHPLKTVGGVLFTKYANGRTDERANTAYCELCWWYSVYELT